MLIIFVFLKSLFFSFFGLNFFDYGETLHNAQRILDGSLLYRDIWAILPPLDNYFPALILKIFGNHLLTIRIVESLIFALFIFIVIRMCSEILNKFYTALLVLCITFADVNTYLLFYQFFFFSAFYLAILYLKKGKTWMIFLSGLLLGIGGMLRHDTAVVATLALGFTLLYKKKIKSLLPFSLGIAVIVAPLMTWLFQNNVFWEFMETAVIRAPQISAVVSNGFSITRLLAQGMTVSNIYYGISLFFYVLYILIFISFVAIYRKKLKSIHVLLLVFGILQIPYAFSVVEMGHLVKAGIPALILGAYVAQNIKNKKVKLIPLGGFFVFLLMGIVTSLWWLAYNNTKFNSPKGWIFISSSFEKGSTHPTTETLNKTLAFLEANTKEGDYIFVAPYHAMIYYLSDRKAPSRFNNFMAGFLQLDKQNEIISSIKDHNVQVVIYDPYNAPHGKTLQDFSPALHQFLMNSYNIIDTTEQGWLLMRLK